MVVGTDVKDVRPEDYLLAREIDGLRWLRCLRCDSWTVYLSPELTSSEHIAPHSEIELPLRGRPLRDRFVLRLIALDRVVHIFVLSVLAVAIFLFAHDRGQLHKTYVRILSDLQGGFGGPIFDTQKGIFHEVNRLFTISTTELYLVGIAVVAYVTVLVFEAAGLWFSRRWAEYLTFLETGVLVPFEIYEISNGVSPLKVLTLIINLAIVLYLLFSKRLFGLRGGGAAERAEKEADSGWGALERSTIDRRFPKLAPSSPDSRPDDENRR
jgi:uncharacterized membrane protein (DUF2068 family)